jgi:hypothetical protein
VTWPYQHRTLAEVDADEALAADTLTRTEIPKSGLTARILALHRVYPEWGATRIAAAIGRNDAYVRVAAQRNGVRLPRSDYGAVPSAGSEYVRAKRQAGLGVEEGR